MTGNKRAEIKRRDAEELAQREADIGRKLESIGCQLRKSHFEGWYDVHDKHGVRTAGGTVDLEWIDGFIAGHKHAEDERTGR